MSLINIEHGSIASSETMNKNFTYLDDKISDTSETIMTSISSILSNIATINTRLNEISEEITDSVDSLSSTIEDYKTKTKLLVNKASMLPNWQNCSKITLSENLKYSVPSNGYLLLNINLIAGGNLIINEFSIKINPTDISETLSQLFAIPVNKGDIVSSDIVFNDTYFLPTKDVSIDEF